MSGLLEVVASPGYRASNSNSRNTVGWVRLVALEPSLDMSQRARPGMGQMPQLPPRHFNHCRNLSLGTSTSMSQALL